MFVFVSHRTYRILYICVCVCVRVCAYIIELQILSKVVVSSTLGDYEALTESKPSRLIVRPTQLVTVGDRAFPVVAAKLWHELPGDVTASQSLTAFRCQLNTFLFRGLYPDS